MKKLSFYTALFFVAMAAVSCNKVDNYAPPSSTITGSTIDEVTGKTLQTEIGGRGTRVKLLETSYSSNPVPIYLESKQDGTFTDTKVFAATYKVSVEGAFVPVVQTDSTGTVTADSSKTIILKNSATLNFKVQPFLRVDWVGQPVVNADKSVSVQVQITRGTNNLSYQLPITNINLYVSNTQVNCSDANYDQRYSTTTSISAAKSDSIFNQHQVITLTTKGGALPQQDVYFRVGAKINAGLSYYNYTTPVNAP
jgi:hypothetical protein